MLYIGVHSTNLRFFVYLVYLLVQRCGYAGTRLLMRVCIRDFCSSGASGWEEQAGSVSSFCPI